MSPARRAALTVVAMASQSPGGTGSNKIFHRRERNAARGDQLYLRQRRLKCAQIFWPTNRAARKNFYNIRARSPGSDNFCGRQCSGEDRDALLLARFNSLKIERRTNHKLRACTNAHLRRFRIEHGACAHENLVTITLTEFIDDIDCARYGHRDFENGNASFTDDFRHSDGFVGRCGSHDGDYAN